jgi:asparagine synthase (glutamine-hydrolysing)
MCGIVASFGFTSANNKRALDAIAHRGPDDEGFFEDGDLFLGHRRLSILDVSKAGHQPMFSASKKFVIIYNGEVYNHLELRKKFLADVSFRSTSDTETIIEGFERHGESFISKLNGIFALCIYDTNEKKIFIARDPLGVKPLYYYHDKTRFIIGSEIKSFIMLPNVALGLDREALEDYITYLWSPGERTPFENIKKLPGGTSVTFTLDSYQGLPKPINYYKHPIPIGVSMAEPEAIDLLEKKLLRAVELQMLSDVPVGFFLSGGLDSSLLVAMAKKLFPNKKLQCFTIRTDAADAKNEGFADDLHYAKLVASYLNVDLEVVDATVDIVKDFDKMIWHLDEPQADPAPLNVLNICTRAREMGYKVLIGGTGGDDFFSGYRRHKAVLHEPIINRIPLFFRQLIFSLADKLPVSNPRFRRVRKVFEQISKDSKARIIGYFQWLDVKQIQLLFRDKIRNRGTQELYLEQLFSSSKTASSYLNQLLYIEQRSFLVDHNLNYTDKMSMAVGVEVRVPYLDLDVVDFASTIPETLKIKRGETKYILKKVAERYLPKDVIYRPKTGFGAPVRSWIINDLDESVNKICQFEKNDAFSAIFDNEKVSELVQRNKAYEVDASYSIWSLLAIKSWIKQFNKEKIE